MYVSTSQHLEDELESVRGVDALPRRLNVALEHVFPEPRPRARVVALLHRRLHRHEVAAQTVRPGQEHDVAACRREERSRWVTEWK